MNVFVTGSSGFIGINLVEQLLNKGWKVRALIRRNSIGLSNKNLEIIRGDILDNNIGRKMGRVDVVIHSAGALPYHKLSDGNYQRTNIQGVKNIVTVAKRQKVKRLIHISTVGIYGKTTRKGVSEKSTPKPYDIYSRTKLEGEKVVRKAISQGLAATIIRPTIGFGPHDTRPGFSNLFSLINRGLFIPVGNGKNYFHTVYIKNLLEAILLSLKKSKAIGEDFIIGDDPVPTMGEIVNKIAEIQGKKLPGFYLPKPAALLVGKVFEAGSIIGLSAPLTSTRVNFITDNRKYSIIKAKKMLAYKPKYTLARSIKETYNWYLKEKLL